MEIRALDNRYILDYLANGTVDVVPTRPAPTMEDDLYVVRDSGTLLLLAIIAFPLFPNGVLLLRRALRKLDLLSPLPSFTEAFPSEVIRFMSNAGTTTSRHFLNAAT